MPAAFVIWWVRPSMMPRWRSSGSRVTSGSMGIPVPVSGPWPASRLIIPGMGSRPSPLEWLSVSQTWSSRPSRMRHWSSLRPLLGSGVWATSWLPATSGSTILAWRSGLTLFVTPLLWRTRFWLRSGIVSPWVRWRLRFLFLLLWRWRFLLLPAAYLKIDVTAQTAGEWLIFRSRGHTRLHLTPWESQAQYKRWNQESYQPHDRTGHLIDRFWALQINIGSAQDHTHTYQVWTCQISWFRLEII